MWKPTCRPLLIGTFVCGFVGVVDVSSSDAQGLFRRLQSRVQSRLETIPPAAPTPSPSQPDAGAGTAQQLSPIDPAAPASRGTSGRSKSPLGSPYGGSILSQPSRNNPAANAGQADTVPRPSMGRPSMGRPSMGIQVVAATQGTPGLKVAGIRPGSRAGEAGLKQDDLIVAIDGTATPTIEAVAEILQQRKVGDRLRATVVRGESAASVLIPLLDPSDLANAAAGQSKLDSAVAGGSEALGRPATDGSDVPRASDGTFSSTEFGAAVSSSPGKRGVVISSVVPGSSAAAAGLRVGDRIVSVNGRLMLDEPTFQREFSRHSPGDELSINAVRDETLNTYDVVLRSGTSSERGGVARSSTASADSPAPDEVGPNTTGPNRTGSGIVAGNSTPGGSVLGGIGSVLGGLFKGSTENKPNVAAVEDPAEDTMDLGDGESIRRVGFEEEIKANAQPLESDPPSVEELTPPVAQPQPDPLAPSGSGVANPEEVSKDGDQKDQIIRALRDEILRLQQRLKELEKD